MAEQEFIDLFPYPELSPFSVKSFDGLMAWISRLPNPQEDGEPKFCDSRVGSPYTELRCIVPYRREDSEGGKLAEAFAAQAIALQISQMLRESDTSRILWREHPETDVWDWDRPIEYRDDGPDYDPLSDKRCVMNKDWALRKVYARLAVIHG